MINVHPHNYLYYNYMNINPYYVTTETTTNNFNSYLSSGIMRTRSFLPFIFFSFLTFSINAQEKPPNLLILEAGIDGIGCAAPDKEYIRTVSDQNFDYYSDQIRALMMLNYIGLKFEHQVITMNNENANFKIKYNPVDHPGLLQ